MYPIIGSISDKDRSIKICEYYGVQTIYHAAAYKHVPLVEYNQSQGVYNNTIGTMVLAEAAIASNVQTFVLISTDKAVRPTNYMGASKRAAEMVLQALAKQPHNTCFTMVRFGNVLDSSGSVIPLFKKQIREGGPVTVTHVDVVRYFMMIPEAVELVIQAGAMANGGEVFVLDMGEPIRIYDLALKMIKLSGLQLRDKINPDGDIEIQYTGLRPGEKLYEELLLGDKFSLTENIILNTYYEEKFSNNIALNWTNAKKEAKKIIEKFDVRTNSEDISADKLSGGNQQKLLIGRELSGSINLLIASQPTRGVDVGSIEYIHNLGAQQSRRRRTKTMTRKISLILPRSWGA